MTRDQCAGSVVCFRRLNWDKNRCFFSVFQSSFTIGSLLGLAIVNLVIVVKGDLEGTIFAYEYLIRVAYATTYHKSCRVNASRQTFTSRKMS